jgi:hypothetical protein
MTLAAAFIGPASSPIGLPDVYWALLLGSWMFANGRLLQTDPFTSAPHVDGPVVNLQWLADLIFQGCAVLGGLPMVITATALVVAATFALLLAAAVAASGHLRLSCVAVWVAYALAATNLSPRPQTLAYPLFAVFLLAVMRSEFRKDTRLLWLLPPATALWANLHGSFFIGFAVLGSAVVARLVTFRGIHSARPYAITLGACMVCSVITPYGPGSLAYLATIGTNPIIRDLVTEWSPTTVNWREGVMFFASVALLAALAYRSRIRLTVFEVLLLLFFGCLAWSSVRAIVWWGMALAPTLARLLGSIVPNRLRPARERPALNAAILAGVALLAVVSLPWFKASLPLLPADKRGLMTPDMPVGVAQYLQTHAPPSSGVLFNDQHWGGYLEWATWPTHQVFVDGRIELHPTQVWLDYLSIVFPSARWRQLVDQYGIGSMVLSKSDERDLVADLRRDPGWHLDYEDDQAVVFSRSTSSGAR